MKKYIILFLTLLCLFGLAACSKGKEEPYVVNTFEATPVELIEEYVNDNKEITTTAYYEMSDGTWRTDEYTYRYKLVVTGRLRNAVADITYVILSNREDITFEQAWKASGLSSILQKSLNYFFHNFYSFVGKSKKDRREIGRVYE